MMKSIKTKLMMVIGIMMVLSLGLVSSFSYWKSSDLLTTQVEDTLTMQTSGMSKEIGLWLGARQNDMEMLASTNDLLSSNPEVILPYIMREDKRLALYEGIFVADTNGNGFSSRGWKGSIKERKYFQQVMSTGKTVFSEALLNKSTGKLSIIVAAPILNNGKLVGLIGANIPFNDINERIISTKVGKTGYNFMIQKDGFVLAHPNVELVMKLNLLEDKTISEDLRTLGKKMVQGEIGIGKYQYNGVGMIAAYMPLPGTDWAIAANIEAREVASRLNSLTQIFIVLTIIILALSIGGAYVITLRMIKPIDVIREVSEKVAAGDLRIGNLHMTSQDEFGQLGRSFATMTKNVAELIRKTQNSAEQLAASSEELTASASQAADASHQVADSIVAVSLGAEKQKEKVDACMETTDTMLRGLYTVIQRTEEIGIMSVKTADATHSGLKSITKMTDQMKNIGTVSGQVQEDVSKLAASSQEIGEIVTVISSIAGQTNLLALNAAIEAARAGEQGRGFAVVADEVRKLAEQSKEAAQRITDLITVNQGDIMAVVNVSRTVESNVNEGIHVVTSAGETFKEIADLVGRVTEKVQETTAAFKHVETGTQDIKNAVEEIDTVSRMVGGETHTVSAATEEQSASMQEIAISSQALAEMAGELHTAISKFKI